MTESVKTRMTAQAFFALPETNHLQQLINGELILDAPKDVHQAAVGNCYHFLRQLKLGGKVRIAPTAVHFDDVNVVEPDVFWVSESNTLCVLGEDQHWHGAPDLIIEVLSPSSVRHDRVTKFQLYERYAVREYWIVQPNVLTVEVWHLEESVFEYQNLYTLVDTFTSPTLKTTVQVHELLTE
ncbi:MAG: Uma2 family endonuclease [bacterium]|nr:Uma2 family endonuclease [bacterium]